MQMFQENAYFVRIYLEYIFLERAAYGEIVALVLSFYLVLRIPDRASEFYRGLRVSVYPSLFKPVKELNSIRLSFPY